MINTAIIARKLQNGKLEYVSHTIRNTPSFNGWWLNVMYSSPDKVEGMIRNRKNLEFEITSSVEADNLGEIETFKTDIGNVYERLCRMNLNKAEKYKREMYGEISLLCRLFNIECMYLYDGDKWYYVLIESNAKIPVEMLFYSYDYRKLLDTVSDYRPNLNDSYIK